MGKTLGVCLCLALLTFPGTTGTSDDKPPDIPLDSCFLIPVKYLLTDFTDIAFYDAITGRDYKALKEYVEVTYPELYRIIDCESKWDPTVCNSKYGCLAGEGLGQIIPKTHLYCESKLKRSIDLQNPKDNLICTLWLYLYEGTSHWEKWSGHCWNHDN